MSLDIEGVLEQHGALGYDDIDGCECGADVRSHAAHRAHVAAVLREQIAAWLGSEAETGDLQRWRVASALAAQVAPSRVPGEGS
jgi:hypothetical protein